MKKSRLAWLLGAVPAMSFASAAHAGDLFCQILWFLPVCNHHVHHGGHTSVPEPATLVLVATGFGAAGVAAWRRRKKKD